MNPVSEEYFNISHQNPIGVVFSLCSSTVSLNDLLLSLLPPLTVGCSVISYSEESSVLALKFAEDINNSDFPAGSLNILTGKFENILDDVSKHVEINLVALHKEIENDGLKRIQEAKRLKILQSNLDRLNLKSVKTLKADASSLIELTPKFIS